MTVAVIRGAMLAALRGLAPAWWLAAIGVATLTDLVDFLAAPRAGVAPGAGFAVALVVRVAAVFFVTYAVARALARIARPLRASGALVRFVLVAFAMTAAFGLFGTLAGRALHLGTRSLAEQWLLLLGVQALWALALIRLVGLQNGMAAGARWHEARAIVAATRGLATPLWLVLMQVVLPFVAMHGALTLLAVRLPLSPRALAALAVVDGVVSGVQLVLTLALGEVALRRAGLPREGALGRAASRH